MSFDENLAKELLKEIKTKGTRKLSKEQEFLEKNIKYIELFLKENLKLTQIAKLMNVEKIKKDFDKEIKAYHVKSFLERHKELKKDK